MRVALQLDADELDTIIGWADAVEAEWGLGDGPEHPYDRLTEALEQLRAEATS